MDNEFETFDDEFSNTDNTTENYIEPALTEQLKEDKAVNELTHEVFKETGMKVAPDDPIVQLMTIIQRITGEKVEEISNQLESLSENIIDNIIGSQSKNQQALDLAFEGKLNELREVLGKLEDQKEMIVADVWRKLEGRVIDKIQSELTTGIQSIANNSNNKVNNERMMLKGGIIGLVIGLVLCAILLFLFK